MCKSSVHALLFFPIIFISVLGFVVVVVCFLFCFVFIVVGFLIYTQLESRATFYNIIHRCSNLNKLLPQKQNNLSQINFCLNQNRYRWKGLFTGLPSFNLQSVSHVLCTARRTREKRTRCVSRFPVWPVNVRVKQ